MTEQIQELQNQVVQLKSRILDATDAANSLQTQVQELSSALQAISELVGLRPNEQGTLALQDIIDGVKAVIPVLEDESDK